MLVQYFPFSSISVQKPNDRGKLVLDFASPLQNNQKTFCHEVDNDAIFKNGIKTEICG